MSDVVWLITHTDYEGSVSICSVFKTKELAKKYVESKLSCTNNKTFKYHREWSDDSITYFFDFTTPQLNSGKDKTLVDTEFYHIEPQTVHESLEIKC